MGRRTQFRMTMSALMIGLAMLTVSGWAIRQAMTPEYDEGWIYSRLVVTDGPLIPPFLGSDAPPAQRERHVREAMADDVLREAAPRTRPDDLRERMRAWCDPPDKIFLAMSSRDPADRATLAAVVTAYVRRHGVWRWHGVTHLGPPNYPRRRAVVVGLSAFWGATTLLALARSAGAGRKAKAQLLALR